MHRNVPLISQVAKFYNGHIFVESVNEHRLGSKGIHGSRFQIRNQISHINHILVGIQCLISNSLIITIIPQRIPILQNFLSQLSLQIKLQGRLNQYEIGTAIGS